MKHYETLELNLSDEDFLAIAKMAHEEDITINHMIERILIKLIISNEVTI